MNPKNKRLLVFLDITLLVFAFYLLFNFVNISIGDSIEQFKIASPTPLALPVAKIHKVSSIDKYDVILKSGLFGDFSPKPTPTPSPVPTLTPTPEPEEEDDEEIVQDYTVKGTIVGKHTSSYVIIEDDSGEEKIYKLGDKLGDFIIKEIKEKEVILKKGKKTITLKFGEEE